MTIKNDTAITVSDGRTIDMDKAIMEMRVILEQAARDRRNFTYTGLGDRMSTIDFDMSEPRYRGIIGMMLNAVADATLRESNVILPVLVVKRKTNRPSKGFFRCAAAAQRNTSDPDRLVLDEQARVFAAYDVH